MTLTELVQKAHGTALEKGWWDGMSPADIERAIPEKLCLIHSEVSEALESFRNREADWILPNGKPVGLSSELADVVIRIADLCGAIGINLEDAVMLKMAYNETRSARHGGKRC